jgi:hypothetical protein
MIEEDFTRIADAADREEIMKILEKFNEATSGKSLYYVINSLHKYCNNFGESLAASFGVEYAKDLCRKVLIGIDMQMQRGIADVATKKEDKK